MNPERICLGIPEVLLERFLNKSLKDFLVKFLKDALD